MVERSQHLYPLVNHQLFIYEQPDEGSDPNEPTDSQKKYFAIPTPGQRLYDEKGRMMTKVTSRNYILIGNASEKVTLQNAKKTQHGNGQLFLNTKMKPRPNITPQQLQCDLHSIRGAVLLLNQSLRFESRQTIHEEVEEMYLTAMRHFFRREWS